MPKSIADNKKSMKKRGRPKTTGSGELIGVRIHELMLSAIDAYIAAEPEPRPTRPEAIRRILAEVLAAKTPDIA